MNKGYVGLLSVLFVGAIGAVVATTIMLLGLASSRNSLALVQSMQAKGMANACAEEALLRIRKLTSYTGIGTLSSNVGNCNYSVTAGSGENRTVLANGYVGSVVRKLSISVTQINPLISASWSEIP